MSLETSFTAASPDFEKPPDQSFLLLSPLEPHMAIQAEDAPGTGLTLRPLDEKNPKQYFVLRPAIDNGLARGVALVNLGFAKAGSNLWYAVNYAGNDKPLVMKQYDRESTPSNAWVIPLRGRPWRDRYPHFSPSPTARRAGTISTIQRERTVLFPTTTRRTIPSGE